MLPKPVGYRGLSSPIIIASIARRVRLRTIVRWINVSPCSQLRDIFENVDQRPVNVLCRPKYYDLN